MSDVTHIFDRVQQGDSKAADELLPLVYEELRKLAAAKMARQIPGQTLQPTALVHEAYLRLTGGGRDQWQDRSHFFRAAAEAMRCILSNRAGIGAKVRVKAVIGGQARWQMRQVDGGDGSFGGSLEADFGLGNATNIEALRIEWPSGIVQEFHNVAPKQFLTLTEPARLQALGAGVLRIQSWKGMAFEMQTSTDLDQWSLLTTVTNLTGTLEFTDLDVPDKGPRFYRAVFR